MEYVSSKSFRSFQIIWFGQLVSTLGSGVSSFGLSVWILTRTNSTMSFAMSCLVGILPAVLLAPLAGSVADRKTRKTILLLADSCDAVLKLILAILWLTDSLTLGSIYAIQFLSSVFGTFQSPAFGASIPQIVPKDKLDRANSMMQILTSLRSMITPVLAGALYPLLQLGGLLILDLATYAVALLTLLFQNIPQPVVEETAFTYRKVWQDFREAYVYIRTKVGLLDLLLIFALMNIFLSMSTVLSGPLVLSNYTSVEFGIAESASGVALMVGALVGGLIPPARNRIRRILWALALSGLGLFISGLSPRLHWIVLGFCLCVLPIAYAQSNLTTLIQLKVEGRILGRVAALMNGMLNLPIPLAYLLAGFLADGVFNPLLNPGGAWADSWIAKLLGSGAGRGCGLTFLLCGMILMLVCLLSHFNSRAIRFETVNPDVLEE